MEKRYVRIFKDGGWTPPSPFSSLVCGSVFKLFESDGQQVSASTKDGTVATFRVTGCCLDNAGTYSVEVLDHPEIPLAL